MAIDKKHMNNQELSQVGESWLDTFSKITVVGLGMSGVGVCRFLSENGFAFSAQDTRDNLPAASEIKKLDGMQTLNIGGFNQTALLESDLIVLSPGVSLQTPEIQAAVKAGISISGDVDIVARLTNVPIIAITGSNGKSTVTQLAGEICKHAGLETFVGGNIGLSVMELLDSSKEYDVAILELSSFQLETVSKLSALSATILNISADHLDRYHGSLDEYAMAKLAVYNNAKQQVWNRQDNWLVKAAKNKSSKGSVESLSTYGLDAPKENTDFGLLQYDDIQWLVKGEQLLISVNDLPLLGEHNIENVLATYALLDCLNLDLNKVSEAIRSFKGLPHRMQKVRELAGVTWVNDSKATNVGATIAAIKGLKGDIILLAGGEGKGADFGELIPWLKQYVSAIYLFGTDSELMKSNWEKVSSCHLVDDLQCAVNLASAQAETGQYVLLAPACASFDMFTGFEQRGEQFIEMVKAL